jgi:hypothetical protein
MGALVGGYDLSGDIMSFSKISGSVATLDVTPISKSAFVRIFGLRDGGIDFNTAFDSAAGASHPVLAALPRGDVQVMGCINLVVGGEAACEVAKQIDYNPNRANTGMLDAAVTSQANGYGLEWAKLLTAYLRTDTAATNGASYDSAASSSFGFQAYLQVTAFTGTDVTVKLQDSADNATFADLAGGAFTQITSGTPQAQRIAVGNTATVRRYIRAVTVTTGGFTSVTFAVAINKNPVAGVVF